MVFRLFLWLALLAVMNFQAAAPIAREGHTTSTGGKSTRPVSSVPRDSSWLTRQAAAARHYHWPKQAHLASSRRDAAVVPLNVADYLDLRSIKARNHAAPGRYELSRDEGCRTPQSLMLHSVYGAENMVALADAIEAAGLQTTTYRTVLEGLRRGGCPPENAVIVSIDDLSSQWIRPGIREMIQVFSDRDMVLVLGVVTHAPSKPSVWEYLRELEHQGHEVASHTMNHLDLPSLDERSLHIELSGSYEALCENLDRCPVTLILPFGDMDPDDFVMGASADYTFVAGILGGRNFAGAPPYYLGRIPPDTQDQNITLRLLRNSFGP